MLFKKLNFTNKHIPVNYDAWADLGIQRQLYRVYEGNDNKWRVICDGSHITNEAYDDYRDGIKKAQVHFETTCNKILNAIQSS